MKSVNKGKIIGVIAVAAVLLLILGLMLGNSGRQEGNAVPQQGDISYEESYQQYLTGNGYDGTMSEEIVEVDLAGFKASDGMEAYMGEEGVITEDSGKVTWSFKVKTSGFYNLELGYIPLPGTTSDIQRKVYIDDEIPYDALSQVVISRYWTDEAIKEKNGNEIRPKSYEVYERNTWFLDD